MRTETDSTGRERYGLPHVLKNIPEPRTSSYVGKSPSYVSSAVVRLALDVGESPFGPPPELHSILTDPAYIDAMEKALVNYSVDPSPAIDNVCERYGIRREKSYVLFSNGGSHEILERFITQLLPPRRGNRSKTYIMGVGPQFPEVKRFVDRQQSYYSIEDTPVSEQRMLYSTFATSLNTPFQKTIEETMDAHKLDQRENIVVYVCNPNTPTGDFAEIETIDKLTKFCAKKGWLLILDEAFGDALENNQSAIPLTEKYPNLVVLRSLSKLVGLPGARIGYAVMSEEIRDFYSWVRREYDLSAPQQVLANFITEPGILERHLTRVRAQAERINGRLMEELEKRNVKYLPKNNKTVPIMAIDGERPDYYENLGRTGVKAAPGNAFFYTHSGMSNQIVRITTPGKLRHVSILARRLEAAKKAA